MFLSVDIGNSNVKFGLFDDYNIVEVYSQTHQEINIEQIKNFKISGAAISSVVPDMTDRVKNHILEKFQISPFLITHKSKFNLILDNEIPNTIGIDRICGVEGAYFNLNEIPLKNNSILLSVDFGTATTINVLESPKTFSGGLILPGLDLMKNSLHNNTKQLPDVDLNAYKSIIGKNTVSAISSGIINSTIGAIQRVKDHYLNKLSKENCYIYITGGNAELLKSNLDFEYVYNKNLVLIGIKRIYEANN